MYIDIYTHTHTFVLNWHSHVSTGRKTARQGKSMKKRKQKKKGMEMTKKSQKSYSMPKNMTASECAWVHRAIANFSPALS